MAWHRIHRTERWTRPVVAFLAAGAAILATSLTGSILATILVALTFALLLSSNWHLRRIVDRALRRLSGDVAEPGGLRSLDAGIADLEQRLAEVDHRQLATHPVSGLPMREALLAQINADGRGLFGAIEFVDFDRLTAFDPATGERVFALLVAKLCKMMLSSRLLAQVDRGNVGIWFGAGLDEQQARAELDAVAYALSDAIIHDGRAIVPQVQVRLARFDRDDGLSAASFLARTLASFAMPAGATAPSRIDPAAVARDRYDLEQDLRQAIARRELSLDFQPLIDAGQRRVCGAEALLRWHHPERGFVSPARFVPVMEAIGLASEIGAWVLNAAVREAGEWRAGSNLDLRVAVNVSGLQLERDDLPMLVERTLERHALTCGCLEIELTESVATSNADHCRRIFEQLRAIGVKLAVDDFGTGYSGFSSLRSLRFDKIKIDREFVTGVDTRRDSQAICQSIIALGRGLGIRVLAEGVERHDEYVWLRRHGCEHFQGYYFSRPLAADRFVAFVRDARGLNALLSLGGDHHGIVERLSA